MSDLGCSMETFLYSINSRFIQGAHFVHEVCWKYISMKQVAEIDSCISAVRRSTMGKPRRKLIVGLRKILSGSTRKVTRSKLLATIFKAKL